MLAPLAEKPSTAGDAQMSEEAELWPRLQEVTLAVPGAAPEETLVSTLQEQVEVAFRGFAARRPIDFELKSLPVQP
jgi:hypothetical protein